jgi:hypothetical protein
VDGGVCELCFGVICGVWLWGIWVVVLRSLGGDWGMWVAMWFVNYVLVVVGSVYEYHAGIRVCVSSDLPIVVLVVKLKPSTKDQHSHWVFLKQIKKISTANGCF